jgi:hypothetical protein
LRNDPERSQSGDAHRSPKPSAQNHSAAKAALDCCENRSFGLRGDVEKRIHDLCRTTQSDRKAVMLTAVQSLRRSCMGAPFFIKQNGFLLPRSRLQNIEKQKQIS